MATWEGQGTFEGKMQSVESGLLKGIGIHKEKK